MKIHIHHFHHLCEEDRELLIAQNELLASMSEDLLMITQEVQNLIAQSQAATDVLGSMDLRFKAMVAQVADLQTQVAALRVGSVMTDAEKASIVKVTGDLAANVSNAQADILANTPDAPAAGDPNAPAGGTPQPVTGAQPDAPAPAPDAPAAATDPNAPTTGA